MTRKNQQSTLRRKPKGTSLTSRKNIRANLENYDVVLAIWNNLSYTSRRFLRQKLGQIFNTEIGKRRLSNMEKNFRAFYETYMEKHNKNIALFEQQMQAYDDALIAYKNGQKDEPPQKPDPIKTHAIDELMYRPKGDEVNLKVKDRYDHSMILADIEEGIKKRRHFVTSGQINGVAFDNAWQSVKTWAQEVDASIWVGAITYGPLRADEDGVIEASMDDCFNGHIVLDTNVRLNKNVVLNTMRLRPTLANPLTGLARMNSQASHIFFHPKNDMESIPTPADRNERMIMASASMTIPDYSTNKLDQQDKTGEFAKRDHVFGGWIVEIEDDEVFHIRPVVFDKNGCFSDTYYNNKGKRIAKRFTPTGTEKTEVAGSLLGDPHFALKPINDALFKKYGKWGTDPVAFETTIDLIKELNIKIVAAGDTFDAHSCSHHDEKDVILMEDKYHAGMLNFEAELDNHARIYQRLFKETDAEYWDIAANHTNGHPYRYISEERYRGRNGSHPLNASNSRFARKLHTMLDEAPRANPVEIYDRSVFTEAENKRITFTSRHQTYEIEGINLGMHGDEGASGARFSHNAGNMLGQICMVGHRHAPGIKGRVWWVGTLAYKDAHYVGYLGGWMHTNGIIFKSFIKGEPGQPMLLNIIDGRTGWNPKTHPQDPRNIEALAKAA